MLGASHFADLWSIVGAGLILFAISSWANTAFGQESLFERLDLSDNIQAALDAIKPVTGLAALITGMGICALSYLFGTWAWYFDLESTYDWLSTLRQATENASSVVIPEYTVFLVTAVSWAPTLIELFTIPLARRIRFLAELVYFFLLFDFLTDFERSANAIQSLLDKGLLNILPEFVQGPVGLLLKLVFTLISSVFFEQAAIVLGIAGVTLVFQGFKKKAAGRGQRNRGGQRTTIEHEAI